VTAYALRLALVAAGLASTAGMACLAYRLGIEILRLLGLSDEWLALLTAGPLPAPDWALALGLVAGGGLAFALLLLAAAFTLDRQEGRR